VKALGKPALQARFSAQGVRLVGNTPEAFAAQIAAEREVWGKVIREANIKAQ
jgi:tripartite-type tricarboxylate transporter receptor subunit TctC